VTIAADPAAVYALITDLPTLAGLAEEADAMEWHKGDCVECGAVFKGHNSNRGKKWTTTCTVTDAERGRVFAFDVKSLTVPVAHWRYDIEAADGGCTVTAGLATGVHDRKTANTEHIRRTLARLKAKAEAASPV
jgi:hypothetical protein